MNANRSGRTRNTHRCSTSVPRGLSAIATILLATAVSGCGSGEGARAEGTREQATRTDGGIPICELLSKQQVSAVLPNNDGGMDMSPGSSLTRNIKTYQCSYSAARGNDADLLTVIVLVGSDASALESVKPDRSAKQNDSPIFRDLEIAQGGMLYGKPGDIEVDAWKGTTLISVELIAPNAERHADSLVSLASLVASKVG